MPNLINFYCVTFYSKSSFDFVGTFVIAIDIHQAGEFGETDLRVAGKLVGEWDHKIIRLATDEEIAFLKNEE